MIWRVNVGSWSSRDVIAIVNAVASRHIPKLEFQARFISHVVNSICNYSFHIVGEDMATKGPFPTFQNGSKFWKRKSYPSQIVVNFIAERSQLFTRLLHFGCRLGSRVIQYIVVKWWYLSVVIFYRTRIEQSAVCWPENKLNFYYTGQAGSTRKQAKCQSWICTCGTKRAVKGTASAYMAENLKCYLVN